jgi:hypothetical protein
MLVTVPVTALICHARTTRKRRISYWSLLASPAITVVALFLIYGLDIEGWGFFTSEYWYRSEGLGDLFVYLGKVAAMCVLPAWGVVVFYQKRSKRDEKHVA